VTTGSLHSLSLISDALINKNDNIIIENPTYPHAHFLFKSLQANIIPADIDEQGICINKINCKNPKFIYSTQSNQYPSGFKMSLGRRLEILIWASLNNTLVIEDDYDHEFSNWENPVSSVFSLDNENRTIYLGTFNKLLHPSIRVGYMIVPEYMKDSIRALYQRSSRFVSPATQTILSYFIEKDYLNKHLRNIIEVSMERKTFFMEQFENHFEKEIVINSHNVGLHVIGALDSKINDLDVSNHFRSKGIIAHPYSNYFINDNKPKGLVMGYGSVNKKVIKETLYKMRQEYLNFSKK
jgi:GntR family transcriptional regulator/MocR family aminotransferase